MTLKKKQVIFALGVGTYAHLSGARPLKHFDLLSFRPAMVGGHWRLHFLQL